MTGGLEEMDVDAALAAVYGQDRDIADMAKPDVRKKRERRNAMNARQASSVLTTSTVAPKQALKAF